MRKITVYIGGHKVVWRGLNTLFVVMWVAGVFIAHGIFWKLMALFNPLYALYKTLYWFIAEVPKWLLTNL